MDNQDILVIKDLKKYYPLGGVFLKGKSLVHAVDGISLSLKKGEVLGLVGESGCGKSTMARLLLRLEAPSEGKIYFEGKDIFKLDRNGLQTLRQKIQIIFQDPFSSLNPRKRVRAILAEPLIIHKLIPRREITERVKELAGMVGLGADQIERYPHQFSSGQRQRIGIARALALNPQVVVADEPVSALDVSIRAQVLNLLSDLKGEFNLTYLFVSHDLNVVQYLCDRIAVMYWGRLVELAPKAELSGNPLHPYTEALLSAIPLPFSHSKERRIILEGDPPSSIEPPPGCRFHPRCFRKAEICLKESPSFTEVRPQHWVSCHKTGSKYL